VTGEEEEAVELIFCAAMPETADRVTNRNVKSKYFNMGASSDRFNNNFTFRVDTATF
jgi:hypothetical protein